MNLIELSYYLQNEQAAKQYLQQHGILKTFTNCIYCQSEKTNLIRRDRMMCYKCRKEWHSRKGSFLEGRHISYSKFIGFLKLYSDEVNPLLISGELSVERKTIMKLYSHTREQVLLINKFTIKEGILKIYISEGKICIGNLSESNLKNVSSYLQIEIKRYKEFGSIYSFMLNACWIGKKNRDYSFINSFLSFIKMKSICYSGISEKYYLDYLCELIIKFNNREQSVYDILIKTLHFSKMAETTQSQENS